MTWITISPVDVWLFRDGKPFTAGEDMQAHSMFPPTPLTVQGALRRQISESLGVSYWEYRNKSTPAAKEAVSYIGPLSETLITNAFQMHGPFLCVYVDTHHVERLYPCPADLLRIKGNPTEEKHQLTITRPEESGVQSDLGNVTLPVTHRKARALQDRWLTASGMATYLAGDIDALEAAYKRSEDIRVGALDGSPAFISNEALYQYENRFGVSTNSQTSFREEGQLYRVQFVRPMDGVQLLAYVEGEHPPELVLGQVTLGGEHRHAFVNELVEGPVAVPIPEKVEGQFKIIFQTPAYLEQGWQPADHDWGAFFGADVTFVGASLYPPTKIGGWNSHQNQPRAMHNYVTAGSVYYFKTRETFSPPLSITEHPPNIQDAARIGFGQVVYGTW